MRTETWKSNKGNEEIHHFIIGTQTYIFGINEKLLGYELYAKVRQLVEDRLEYLENEHRAE